MAAEAVKREGLEPEKLFSLSDALQMEMTISNDTVDGVVQTPVIIPSLGLSIPFPLRIMSNRIERVQGKVGDIAILCKVVGNLQLLAVHEEGKVHVFMIDKTKLPKPVMFEQDKRRLFPILDEIKDAFVASFMRGDYDQAWTKNSDLLDVKPS